LGAPARGARPFVSAGDTVKKGQTLLIIEAMKTMNPVAAPRAGKVAQILVADGAPVEYGEVLLILE
jgi:acetyl-CoA carboxylase biotin carboxyl carrier protein